MIHTLTPNQNYYRITALNRPWREVLSGQGAHFLTGAGNRYNAVLQRAAYVCGDLRVAITEFAYYVARDWQDRLAKHHLVPVLGPLRSSFSLWQFSLQQPTHVVDVEHAMAQPWHFPHYALLNPTSNYATTQHVANHAIASAFPGHAPPQRGLRVPAVRSRHLATDQQVNYVLYRLPGSPVGQLTGKWIVVIEFLDLNGNQVGPTSPRIDWTRPRFQLLVARGRVASTLPPPYVLGNWDFVQINYA